MILFTDKHRIPFQIDADDYEAVLRYAWHLSNGYLGTIIGKRPHRKPMRLHTFLMGRPQAGKEWDHWNRDKLDNRRGNLRAVSPTINQRNIGIARNNTSGVRGVYWSTTYRRWVADIKVSRRTIHLGAFDTIEAAAAARVRAEQELWGAAR